MSVPAPVFVLSAPRSGSTLFQLILGGHPMLFCPPEMALLPYAHIGQWLERVLTLHSRATVERMFAAFMGLHDVNEAGAQLDELCRRGTPIDELYQLIKRRAAPRRLVDKTPSYALRIETLRRAESLFEGARYIHLVRHPYSGIASFVRARFDKLSGSPKGDPFAIAEQNWTTSNGNIRAFCRELEPDRFLRVRYEDLVEQTESTLRRLTDWLGIPFDAAMLRPYESGGALSGLGDPNIMRHGRIDPALGSVWRRIRLPRPLGAYTRRLAEGFAYELANEHAKPGEGTSAAEVSERPPLVVVPRDRDLPLSFAQERLWVLDQMGAGAAYNMPTVLRFSGALDTSAVERALTEIARRHEALRTVFPIVEDLPVVEICPPFEVTLEQCDVTSARDPEAEAQRLAEAERAQAFDLATGPLLRAKLIRVAPEVRLLVIIVHHIVADGWSLRLLVRELATLYAAFIEGRPSPLPEPPLHYTDFAVWQRSWLSDQELETQFAYWRRRLAGVSPLELPTDHRRPRTRRHRGSSVRETIPVELSEKLTALSAEAGVTVFMTLLAAFGVLLRRYAGQDDIVVGSPVATRPDRSLEDVVGFFINMLVIRSQVKGDATWRELLTETRRIVLEAQEHQDLPFERLVDEFAPERDPSRNPIFSVTFSVANAQAQGGVPDGVAATSVPMRFETTHFDLEAIVAPTRHGFSVKFIYDADLFEAATIERMLGHYGVLLEAIAADPAASISDLPMLSASERELVLVEWNRTDRDHALETTLHERFETQASRTPEDVAVVCGDQSLTYAELNGRANQLARLLGSRGVGPEVPVGVFMERSLEMVVSLYGILKAGGAYVPLDPEDPKPRLARMLSTARVPVLLTQSRLVGEVPAESSAEVVRLDADWGAILTEDDGPVPNKVQADNLAYVIFTSGSTGAPKGAMNTHRAICNRLDWMQEAYDLTAADRVLQKTPYTFDVSVWEFFWPLRVGARLVVAAPRAHRDPDELVRLIGEHKITTIHFVPSMLQAFLEASDLAPARSLRRVICSGEALPLALHDKFLGALDAELHNLYGPTEAAIDVTFHACSPDDGLRSVPIGRPVANTQIYLLDETMQPTPVGVQGHLHIGGVQVGRGYLGRPALTAERFVADPFSKQPGTRLYATGDRARYRADGSIEFLGRIDHQVKVRGHRIELGEIERVLETHDGAAQASVIVREDEPGDRRLVAYVVPDATHAFAVRQGVALEAAGRFEGIERLELPNGLAVAHLNRNETTFLYDEIFRHQVYEQHGITLSSGDVVFDVGANVGLFTLAIGLHYPDIRIHAFEPIPSVCEVARLNAEIYGLNANVTACGLADQAGTATFTYYPSMSILSSRFADVASQRETIRAFLGNQQNGNDVAEADDELLEELITSRLATEEVTCELRTVSDVMRERGLDRIDLLKVDVEKDELNVLQGVAEQDWPRIRQVILEVHDDDGRLANVIALLESVGFTVDVGQDEQLEDTGLYTVHALRGERVRGGASSGGVRIEGWASPRMLQQDLRQHARASLPSYMVPTDVVILDQMPLTPSGKVSQRELPTPNRGRSSATYVEPRDETERLLAEIFQDVLGVKRVGIHDSFFELGGHSLKATQVIARARKILGSNAGVQTIFDAPTIAALASMLDGSRREAVGAAIEPRDPLAKPVLSFAQQRLWFLDRLAPDSAAYNVASVLTLRGRLQPEALAEAITEIGRRHAVLRTTFQEHDGQPTPVVDEHARIELSEHAVEGDDPVARRAAAQQHVEQLARQPFDLARGPLMRAVLYPIGRDEWILALMMHHIVSDGWSMGVLMSELGTLYRAYAQKTTPELSELPVQYADFAHWQRRVLEGPVLEAQLAHWRERLDGAPSVLTIPPDRPRPALQTDHGELMTFALPEALCETMDHLGRREHASSFMTLLATVSALLARLTGEADIVIGTPVAGRSHDELEGLIGCFINTLVLRINCAGDPTFTELIAIARRASLDAFDHQDVPFERLVEELQPDRNLSVSPLFQILFVVQNAPREPMTLPGVTVRPVKRRGVRAKFDMTLTFVPSEGRWVGAVEYNTDLYDAATIESLIGRFERLLEAATAEPERRLSSIDVTTSEERRRLAGWNATNRPYADDACVHELVEAQVSRAADAVAVAFKDRELTYRELDERANQLAHHLVALGVGPESRVGLCLERSPEMLVAVLAVLKAGGAYVPLDVAFPPERLAWMLEDSGAKWLISRVRVLRALPELAAAVGESSCRSILIDDEAEAALIVDRPATAVGPRATAADLAYVIYTSGSTGRPKGVQVPHGGVVNFLQSMAETPGLASTDVMLAVTTLSFDIAVLELLLPLSVGARVVIASGAIVADGEALAAEVQRAGVTVMQGTPATWQLLVRAGWRNERIRILCGGEELPPALATSLAKCGHELWNLYGPTETTVWSVVHRVETGDGPVPLGRPIANTQIHVVDAHGQPAPPGAVGEVWIGGAGVTRGYHARPALTAERFVPDPFSDVPGARLYRTGDLARFDGTGELQFLGRADHQVKLRGFRIELGEIQAALADQPGVDDVVVTLGPGDDDARLVAYLVPSGGASVPAVADLRRALGRRLPTYMVPSAFVTLETLPRTPNGKLDRRALPQPELTGGAATAPPETPTQRLVAEIWSELLGAKEVGLDDDFFALGGHSLIATQLISRIRSVFDVDLALRTIFESPTLGALADEIDGCVLSRMDVADLRREIEAIKSLTDKELQAVVESRKAEE